MYSKLYLTNANIIVEYLACYSHRIVLNNSRLVAIQEDQVLCASSTLVFWKVVANTAAKIALIRTSMGQAEPEVEEKTQEPSVVY